MMICSMPGGHRLLDAVLDDRLVDQRQHLLGLRLGRGQEAGAPAGGREDGFTDAHRTSVGRVSAGRGMSRPSLAPDPLRAGRRPGLPGARSRRWKALDEAPDGEAERPGSVQVGEVGRAPQPDPASIPGGPREAVHAPRRKSRSHSPLRMRVGPGYIGEARVRTARPTMARRACAPPADQKPPATIGLGDVPAEAGPEEPRVEGIERRPVEPIHDPGEREIRRGEDAHGSAVAPDRTSPRTSSGRRAARSIATYPPSDRPTTTACPPPASSIASRQLVGGASER